MKTKKIFMTVLLSLLVVILLSIFTGCNVIKSDLLLPELMVLRKALTSVGSADNSNIPVSAACSETATITKSGSPYLTAGKNVYNDPIYGSITTNRNGDARPSSGSWSVGAY